LGKQKVVPMANSAMVDIETLDTRPTAVVFQVGIVIFNDPFLEDKLKIREGKLFQLDILPQIMHGRTIDKDTVDWWKTQNPMAWRRGPDEVTMLIQMDLWIKEQFRLHGVSDVWSNSPSFDAVILRSLWESMELKDFPFSFRQDMDLRTIKQMLRKMDRLQDYGLVESPSHNALKDATDQTKLLGFMLGELAKKP
jgi:hypothetical protein